MSNNKINSMIEVSLEKEKLLNEFLDSTNIQSKLIGEEEFEKLDDLISKKSGIMKKIDKLDNQFVRELEEFKTLEGIQSMEDIDGAKYKNLKQLKSTIERIGEILKEIYQVDSENTKLISRNLDGVKSELRHVKNSKVAYKGYNVEPTGSIMIDERK